MFDVRGIPFTDCDFENLNTTMPDLQREEAIFALDAGFTIEPLCSFTGFERALNVNNAGSLTPLALNNPALVTTMQGFILITPIMPLF
jgi:hypothetical protein